MNVTVIGQIGPVRTVTGVGCIEFGPGSAALLRNEQGGVLASIVLGDGYSLAIGGRTMKGKATGRGARRELADAKRALRLRASQRVALRAVGARRTEPPGAIPELRRQRKVSRRGATAPE